MNEVKQFSANKILNHPERVAQWLHTGTVFPITYEFDLTNRCNNDCPYCFGFRDRQAHREAVDRKFIERVLRQIAAAGGKAVTFTGGGEPLLHPDVLYAVRLAKRLKLDVGFITNGLALTPAAARVLLRSAVWVRVSIDAATAKTYKLMHGVDGFDRVLANVRVLARLKKKMRSATTVGVAFLTCRETRREIVPFARLGRALGVDYVQYRPLLTPSEDKYIDQHADYAQDIIRRIDRARNLGTRACDILFSKHKYDVVAGGEKMRNYGACHGHHFATVIAADKKMYLCCHMRGQKKYCLGDLAKQSLRQVWRSARRQRVFQNIDFHDCPFLCRCDSFNTILWNIAQPKPHINFL